jgi:putative peptidoglycan binding protein
MPEYIVRQGDCINSIARKNGLHWEKIWNHENNAKLKSKRKDPDVLLTGDKVFIPEKEIKEEKGSTEMRHRFRVKGIPAEFRMIVEQNGISMANKSYVLEIDGYIYSGATNDKGLLKTNIDPNAKRGQLRIGDLVVELELGAMDPIDESVGVQSRLQNLGFYEGEIDGKIGTETKMALSTFQRATGLAVTNELDDATRQKLLDWQDEEHEQVAIEDEEEEGEDSGDEGFEEETGEPDGAIGEDES